MPTPSKRQKIVLNVLGVGYTLFAIFALVNVYTLWKLSGASPLSYLLYGLLYAILAAMFFGRQRWLLAFFAVNLFANAWLFVSRSYAAQAISPLAVVIVGLNALLVWYLYSIRHALRDSLTARIVAASAFVLWVGTIYAVINKL